MHTQDRRTDGRGITHIAASHREGSSEDDFYSVIACTAIESRKGYAMIHPFIRTC